MRRGLMAWDAEELPLAALQARVLRLQQAMEAVGQDAMLLYTNFIRSGAVSYLTAFSPYWADGVLLVPRQGEPVFSTTLSKRVGGWIQAVKPIGDLVNSPTPGTVLGKRLAAQGDIRRLAILERDGFPSGLYDDFAATLPDAEIVDGSAVFAVARAHLDAPERQLLVTADRMARTALALWQNAQPGNAGEAVGSVERHARLAGAEEVYVAIAPDLDTGHRFRRLSGNAGLGQRFALRVTLAYKGSWVRRTQSFAPQDQGTIRLGDSWLNDLSASLDAGLPLQRQIAEAAARLPGAQLIDWLAEGAIGTRPLTAVASMAVQSNIPPLAALTLSVALRIEGVPWCGAALTRLRDAPA